jgi:hypothetical protein
MIDHPFITTAAEYEEYREACEDFADAADKLPDPPPEIFLDDSHLDGNWEDYEYEGGEDRYLDAYWEDQSEYGMDGCCGDF